MSRAGMLRFLGVGLMVAFVLAGGCVRPPRVTPVRERYAGPPSDSLPEALTTRKVTIYADQPGAILVVDGVPMGKCPMEVLVKATPQGFMRETVSIRVRFLAGQGRAESSTVECSLGLADKVPTVLRFSQTGVKREF